MFTNQTIRSSVNNVCMIKFRIIEESTEMLTQAVSFKFRVTKDGMVKSFWTYWAARQIRKLFDYRQYKMHNARTQNLGRELRNIDLLVNGENN